MVTAVDEDLKPARAFVALRIWIGLGFLVAAWDKLAREGGYGRALRFLVENVYAESAFAFYRPFLSRVVLPNADLFAGLVAYGEVAVGVALVLGIVTRAAAAVASSS